MCHIQPHLTSRRSAWGAWARRGRVRQFELDIFRSILRPFRSVLHSETPFCNSGAISYCLSENEWPCIQQRTVREENGLQDQGKRPCISNVRNGKCWTDRLIPRSQFAYVCSGLIVCPFSCAVQDDDDAVFYNQQFQKKNDYKGKRKASGIARASTTTEVVNARPLPVRHEEYVHSCLEFSGFI